MRVLAMTLLIPFVMIAACSRKDSSNAMSTPPPAGMSGTATTTSAAPLPAPTQASAPAQTPAPASAQVSLISAAGSSVKGDLMLTNEGTDLSIRGEITGLAPGKEHGFHVHEVGECSLPDFTSAGAHFNPTKDPHGGPKSKTRHLGDIPNVKADENGRATVDVTVKGPTLGDTDDGPAQILGKAFVVHAMPDDYKTQPSGDSGARVACGVIR